MLWEGLFRLLGFGTYLKQYWVRGMFFSNSTRWFVLEGFKTCILKPAPFLSVTINSILFFFLLPRTILLYGLKQWCLNPLKLSELRVTMLNSCLSSVQSQAVASQLNNNMRWNELCTGASLQKQQVVGWLIWGIRKTPSKRLLGLCTKNWKGKH